MRNNTNLITKKEFAYKRNVVVRTVDLWIKRGMPVQRFGEGKKPRVFIDFDKATSWLSCGKEQHTALQDDKQIVFPPERNEKEELITSVAIREGYPLPVYFIEAGGRSPRGYFSPSLFPSSSIERIQMLKDEEEISSFWDLVQKNGGSVAVIYTDGKLTIDGIDPKSIDDDESNCIELEYGILYISASKADDFGGYVL